MAERFWSGVLGTGKPPAKAIPAIHRGSDFLSGDPLVVFGLAVSSPGGRCVHGPGMSWPSWDFMLVVNGFQGSLACT